MEIKVCGNYPQEAMVCPQYIHADTSISPKIVTFPAVFFKTDVDMFSLVGRHPTIVLNYDSVRYLFTNATIGIMSKDGPFEYVILADQIRNLA